MTRTRPFIVRPHGFIDEAPVLAAFPARTGRGGAGLDRRPRSILLDVGVVSRREDVERVRRVMRCRDMPPPLVARQEPDPPRDTSRAAFITATSGPSATGSSRSSGHRTDLGVKKARRCDPHGGAALASCLDRPSRPINDGGVPRPGRRCQRCFLIFALRHLSSSDFEDYARSRLAKARRARWPARCSAGADRSGTVQSPGPASRPGRGRVLERAALAADLREFAMVPRTMTAKIECPTGVTTTDRFDNMGALLSLRASDRSFRRGRKPHPCADGHGGAALATISSPSPQRLDISRL